MNRIARLAIAIAATAALAAPRTIAAQGAGQAVAVAPFNLHEARRDARDFHGVGTAIADLLAAELRAGGVGVADRGPMQRTVALQPRGREGMLGREGAVAAAKVLGAQHVVYGGFTADQAGNVRLDARAVNVGSSAVEATERLQGHGDEIPAMVHQLAARLASAMSLTLAQGAPQAGPVPLRALADYGKALEAMDHGDRAGARSLLQALVQDHPDFAPARAALAAASDR
jgi:sugar phosphate isomerase/epimerase